MKKVLIFLLLVNFVTYSYGQQHIQLSQYMLNQYIVNPGVTGTGGLVDVATSYRVQWLGLPGAPRTYYLTAHAPLGETREGRGIKNRAKAHHGIGLNFTGDKAGLINRNLLSLSYAYNLPLTDEIRLSTGASLGIQQYRIEGSKAEMIGEDPALPAQDLTQIMPDVSVGSFLYSERFYVGLALNQILKNRLDYQLNNAAVKELGHLNYHFFLTGGYSFSFHEDWEIIPSVMVRYVSPAPPSVDLNGKIRFRKLVWLGASYRHKDAIALMGGLRIINWFNIGYAYDATTSPLSQFQNNTHEVMLRFSLLLEDKYQGIPNIW